MVNPPPTGLQPLTLSKDTAASGHPGQRVGNLPAPLARPAPAPNPQRRGPTPPTGGTSLPSGPRQSPCLGSWPTKPPPPTTPGSWQTKTPRPTAQQSPPSGRGSGIKIGEKKIAQNAIFRVVSCLYILYDLTCLIWLKKSTHSHSFKAYHCFIMFFTSD